MNWKFWKKPEPTIAQRMEGMRRDHAISCARLEELQIQIGNISNRPVPLLTMACDLAAHIAALEYDMEQLKP